MSRERVLVRGCTYENVLNLGRGCIEEFERDYGGTRQLEEELYAKMFSDSEGATCKATDIIRRERPVRFVRTALAIDAAVTARAGSDESGIQVGGVGLDGLGYVLKDLSGKHRAGTWAELALDAYFEYGCDCIVVETNKGGDLVAQNLRASADKRGVEVIILDKKEEPRHIPGTLSADKKRSGGVVYIREVYARGEKSDRAQPVSNAYEQKRIVHVTEEKFIELEEILTTWIPGPGRRSPDRLDALVHLMVELLKLGERKPDQKRNFAGIGALAAAVQGTPALSVTAAPVLAVPGNLATLLGVGGDIGGDRI
jgi:phage terminase large subunit-like protein